MPSVKWPLERRIDHFWARVAKGEPNDCWEWTASCGPQGYGTTWNGKRMVGAHITAYELTHGPLVQPVNRKGASGIVVCHTCDNPPCCNPAHLFAGSQSDNVRDAVSKGRLGAHTVGSKNVKAVLTESQAAEIRQRWTGKHGQMTALANEYGVHSSTIGALVYGRTWNPAGGQLASSREPGHSLNRETFRCGCGVQFTKSYQPARREWHAHKDSVRQERLAKYGDGT